MSKQKPLKERRKEAELLVQQIDTQLNSARGAVKECNVELFKAMNVKSDFQKLIPQIKRVTKNANTAIEKIRADRDRLSSLLTSVNHFYEKKYVPLEEKINNPDTGLKARLTQGNQFKIELNKLKENSEKELKLIKGLTTDFRKKLNELKSIENALRRINSQILDHEKSITEKRTKVDADTIAVEAATKNILDKQKTVIDIEQDISNLHKESEQAYDQINKWHHEANTTLEEIKKIYAIAAGTGLGGEFDKRRNSLEDDLKKWSKYLLGITGLLFLVVIVLFCLQIRLADGDLNKLKFDANFYVRFIITSPLIYYLVFVTRQFNRTKALLEKYSFKTTIAFSIDAHINLLTGIEEFKDKERMDKIANFILDGFNKIYEEPYQKIDEKEISSMPHKTLKLLKKEAKHLTPFDSEKNISSILGEILNLLKKVTESLPPKN